MNQISATPWSPMVSGPEEEFANFLEFGDLQLSFPPFEGAVQDGSELQQEPGGAMDTPMGNETGVLELEDGHNNHQELNQRNPLRFMAGFQGSTETFHEMHMQTDLFNPHQHQQLHMHGPQYRGRNIIPPTPNSIEMHGDQARYYRSAGEHQTHTTYERYGRNQSQNQKDQMIFTPLVSPAVTPLDTQFQYPEYPVPGEYFSPLTSPALEAQRHATQHSVYGAVRNSDTSDTTSPVDANIDFSAPMGTSSSIPARKSKRKPASASKSSGRTVKQSPSMKPQSRKRPSTSSIIPPKEVPGIIEDAQRSKKMGSKVPASTGKLALPYNQDSSEAGSISPEPLSEILMPPPATPRSSSSSKSPYLNAKQSGSQSAPLVAMSGEPATPASLMKIRKEASKIRGQPRSSSLKEQASLADGEVEQAMEDVASAEPENVTTRPELTPLDTSKEKLDQTPTISAHKDTSTPSSAPGVTGKAFFTSPRLPGVTSPKGSSSTKRVEPKSMGRDNKKRNSTSSVHVSPAIRPKMSPSIKPLLPEGVNVNAETSALLLASKSNYQNILEGTHLPGVSYPEALSTNLTSKRTSHKIAEQGRRNRINTALQEIASLLPPPPPTMSGDSGSQTAGVASIIMTGTAAQQSSSKASTVELAIEYIKSLQAELRDVKGKLADATSKLDRPQDDA